MHTRLRNRKQALVVLLWFSAFILVMLCVVDVAATQLYRGRYYNSICTDTQTGRELYVGEFFMRPGQCIRAQCLGTLQIWEDKCQIPKLGDNCTRLPPANEFLDYPKCCPLYQCKNYKTNTHGETEETRVYDHYGMLQKTDIRQIFVIMDPREKGKVPGSGVTTQFEI